MGKRGGGGGGGESLTPRLIDDRRADERLSRRGREQRQPGRGGREGEGGGGETLRLRDVWT